MTDRPIIFSAPMVLALLDGRKSMTRRLAWRRPKLLECTEEYMRSNAPGKLSPWQRVQPGDRLWVRENWRLSGGPTKGRIVVYSAGGEMRPDTHAVWEHGAIRIKWCDRQQPSIHMPRWASRLTLVVTATKIERLQDISDADCIAEGPPNVGRSRLLGTMMVVPDPERPGCSETVRCWYRELWSKLHGTASWDANPEVVALTFTVHQRNIDAMKEAA